MSLRVPSKDCSPEPVTNEGLPSVSDQSSVSESFIPSDVPLTLYYYPDVAKPASRAVPFSFPISQTATFVDHAAPNSSVPPFPSVSLQNRTVALLNASGFELLI